MESDSRRAHNKKSLLSIGVLMLSLAALQGPLLRMQQAPPVVAVRSGGAALITLDRPIKTLGVHPVKVRLHPEVAITVNINVARSQDEAERQARGENVIASQFDEDRAMGAEAIADLLEGGAGQQGPAPEEP